MTELSHSMPSAPVMLHVALDLGSTRWLLASGCSMASAARHKSLKAGDLAELRKELQTAKAHFRLPADAPVRSCYEAGRDGAWVHRALLEMGVESLVIDSSSIEVNRRMRRAKTDRIDARKLLQLLLRYGHGERNAFSIVHVPDEQQEDERRCNRELARLTKEASALTNRVKGLLQTQGITFRGSLHKLELDALRDWRDQPLHPRLLADLERSVQRFRLTQEQVREIESERKQRLKQPCDPLTKQVAMLMAVRGIGPRTAWVLATELFAWRDFKNGRQLGAFLGMTATPYCSDRTQREQGISKSGPPRLRGHMTEIAWLWLRLQPDSTLAKWFQERFGQGGRSRRVGIVALARKLTIALWRYIQHGVIPDGATVSSTN